ncbi:MAG TPA: hypothetical protein VMU26_15155 [Candidatus Polarisedimenticolia bacterium]|nr:hypothetical protein [Candidatus Polarisedimenticolia bacterium]
MDDEHRIPSRGNRHPLAPAQHEAGIVSSRYRMERMLPSLRPDALQQEALNRLPDAQQNPESPCYQQWFTPQQFGEHFGVSESEAAASPWPQRSAEVSMRPSLFQ